MFWRSHTRFIPMVGVWRIRRCLQGSEAVRRLVGASRIRDPTTAGDFLRRFKTTPQVAQLSEVIDDIEEAVGVAETFSVELGRGFELTFTATGSSSEMASAPGYSFSVWSRR
jgi:hypothetical protein